MTKEWCRCDAMSNAGDMAPSLWICPTHGKTGRIFVHMLWLEFSKQIPIPEEDFWDIARGLLTTKQLQAYLDNQRIYFDEDYFQEDLRKHLQVMFPQSEPPKSKPRFFKLLGR